MIWLALGGALLGLAVLAYWQFIVAEGSYLGPPVVAWTYDLIARRYDAIKRFVPRYENWFITMPLLEALDGREQPLVLDVGTGTGRLPLLLLAAHFSGYVVGLDFSRRMLRQARAKLRIYGSQSGLVWQDASRLPFDDETFDAVTCLESLEFMPQPGEVLTEMVRVLAPGGVLFISNRVGREARLLPGRVWTRTDLPQVLADLLLEQVQIEPWQSDYDLVMGRKAAVPDQNAGERIEWAGLEDLLRCPHCDGPLEPGVARLSCPACGLHYAFREGIVHLAAPLRDGSV